MSEKEALALLLDKPSEPLLVPKGLENVVFQVPRTFLNAKYRKNSNLLLKNTNNKHVLVKNTSLPVEEISKISEIDKSFSLFIPKHMDAAASLIKILMGAKNIEDLLSVATYCRERVSPVLFNYALSVTMLHREDTRDVELPNFFTSFPAKFVESSVFPTLRLGANLLPTTSREPIVIRKNFTATDREPEQAVAYFREDIGVNLHHWHWHLVYPSRGSYDIVDKDRRGELFYYMHEQVLARYNTERLCNNMEMVKSLNNLREVIPEGYFPKLHQLNANRACPPRFRNCFLRDLDRPSDGLNIKISDVEQYIEKIREAIRAGHVEDEDGNILQLDPVNGIDILGNIVECSELTVNYPLYGSVHNTIHIVIALCHDPEEKYLESFGIMGDTATAMRDPVFYRWHSAINDIFVSHKITLPQYTREELDFNHINITNLKVHTNLPDIKTENELRTFWEQSDVDLSRGLDFVPKGPLPIRITHLQHEQFTYTIVVNNDSANEVKGTVRIFMAPTRDNTNINYTLEMQRQLMIEMDKFTVTLHPGANTIERQSKDSSVRIDYNVTFRPITTSSTDFSVNYCGCGWPDHMLIPKGTVAGYQMTLFAMVSDYNVDRVEQEPSNICLGAESYCGVFNRKYPDTRGMGYPFDRRPANGVTELSQFLTGNMKAIQITIKHINKTVVRETETFSNVFPAVVGS